MYLKNACRQSELKCITAVRLHSSGREEMAGWESAIIELSHMTKCSKNNLDYMYR